MRVLRAPRLARHALGFTLIELMIVLVIIGILAAIGAANYIAMQARAKEGVLKSNMRTFQLTAEDYNIVNLVYANRADSVARLLPGNGANFRNPFDQRTGKDRAWEDRSSINQDPTALPGLTSYSGNASRYNIKGYGKSSTLTLVYEVLP